VGLEGGEGGHGGVEGPTKAEVGEGLEQRVCVWV